MVLDNLRVHSTSIKGFGRSRVWLGTGVRRPKKPTASDGCQEQTNKNNPFSFRGHTFSMGAGGGRKQGRAFGRDAGDGQGQFGKDDFAAGARLHFLQLEI